MSTIDYSKHYYSARDKDSPVWHLLANRNFETIRPYLPANREAPILEIGPGNGLVISLLLKNEYKNALGLDIDKNLALDAQKYGIPIKYVPEDKVNDFLRKDENKYALIFFMHVLEHVSVEHQAEFISSVRFALAPGGKLVCEVPNADSPLAARWRYCDWTHKCLFSIESLRFILKIGGFQEVLTMKAKSAVITQRGLFIDTIVCIIKVAFNTFSESIQKIHLIAGIGLEGLKIPVSAAILGIGIKQDSQNEH
ncbi:hypothetical protein GCM10010909_19940 [Acidocella aquatica]|uniref:Class I SAM-dependent methyltransferase n=1 Tax=Acidocella aquatica TaxID=1922313 RepID=A0ABQ6A6M7_9PROT|nr:class I SAM-dependent methyltransferase [Acidocella aquatica]GLR67313.1 hypothetical protein GCM10010909_19940 [Acidocella aquatica]